MSAPPALEHLDPPRLHARVRLGIRQPANWLQLLRFAAVGASGYLVNLVSFAVATGLLGSGYRVAAVFAFAVAVTNNFVLNRHWTFRARGRRAIHHQVVRFFVVSVAAFALQFAMLEVLVSVLGTGELLGQAISVLVAMPCNFIGNRLWTFTQRSASS